MKQDQNTETKKTNNYGWLLIPFIGFLFLALWGFTRIAIWDAWKFDSTTGQIGDTIGGITAPFINLLGAILVYLSFQQQKRANEIQVKEIEKQRIALQEDRNRTNAIDKFNQLVNLMEDLEKNIISFGDKISLTSIGTSISYVTSHNKGENKEVLHIIHWF